MSAAEDRVGRVSGEIDSLRGELGALVAELDRRRHEALDLRLQVRRHPVAAALVAVALAAAVGGLVAFAVRDRRRRRRPSVRARETRRAIARLLSEPERVAAEPSAASRALGVAATAAATALARQLLQGRAAKPARAR